MPETTPRIDVALNIFAKPYQTALAILSLLRHSGQHVSRLWFQYEPRGCAYDKAPPYGIYEYITEKSIVPCEVSQPGIWIDLDSAQPDKFGDPSYRHALRYQYAFEHSDAKYLFVIHNDVYFLKDILTPMLAEIGDNFAIGQLGQCWNCPAANSELMRDVLDRPPCTPDTYGDFRPDADQLKALYAEAAKRGIFARPYDKYGFRGEFAERPWPLPECRINEWACLLDLEKTRTLTVPEGDVFPFGGYRPCADLNLDIGCAWFRDLHEKGLHAKNFNIKPYLRHWVGTGNNTPIRYLRSEGNAGNLLRKHFPEYIAWLETRYPDLRQNHSSS